jgi:hypothetical protein
VLVLLLSLSAQAAPVTQITLGDFTSPRVLDFETAALGTVSGTDALFTDFGIAEMLGTGSSFIDPFDLRPSASRALWIGSGGLEVVDPGTPDNAGLSDYEIRLASDHFRFGIAVHDYFPGADLTFEFFDGGTSVGSISVANPTADLSPFYFEVGAAFNRVTVIPAAGNGFAIDNITLLDRDASIPEPGVMLLLGSAFVAVWVLRVRRRQPLAA